MASLLDANRPEDVIRRYESGQFAVSNRDCTELYIHALYQANRLEKLTKLLQTTNDADNAGAETGETQVKASTKQTRFDKPEGNIGYSKERPLFVQTVATQQESRFWKGLGGLINLLISGGILFILYKSTSGRLEDFFGKTVHKVYQKKGGDNQNAPSFDDVRGCDEAKEELMEIVDFLKNPEKFNRLGARLPKGVLLVGPPGTGKTLLARAVAGEANVPFIYASGSEFDEMFVGLGSMRIRQMFEEAKKQAPAIIFIDEIDAIGSKRNPRDPQHARMSLNQLLVELDGFSGTEGVVVITATNFPETLDKALLRPGRFDRHVSVMLPDLRGRKDILNLFLTRDTKCKVGKDVSVETLARGTPGFSGADLAKLVNQAKITASKTASPYLTMAHLEAAKDEMLMGQERKSAMLTQADRELTAYHEGGHALVALLTPAAMPIHKATIVPRGRALGMVAQLPERDHPSLTKAQLLARLDVAMAGRVAEELAFGREQVTTGASSDFAQANAIARAMVCEYGMGGGDEDNEMRFLSVNEGDHPETLSPSTRAVMDVRTAELLTAAEARARHILTCHRLALDKLAAALLDQETLTREQIEKIVHS